MKQILKILAWGAIALAGAGALAAIAFERREPLNAVWFIVAALCTFLVSYRFYSAFLAAKIFALDNTRATPAERLEDGRDFVPTNKWVLLGHHFAAIAGPGPLVGPTLAAQFDSDLHLYYNRARYLNVTTGRFWSMDTNEGFDRQPLSLHRYLYVGANPVNLVDPGGHDFDLGSTVAALGEGQTIESTEAEADSLAIRVFNTLTSRGATFTILGTASSLVPAFEELADAFEENEGIVVELQDELFAIRYVATQAEADGVWWGTQVFNNAQEAIDALALNPV